ncbi:uncharacterized protein LOC144864098 isoform X18 [Branchiostoma floridae x Branchiostoma japonicum]
MASLSLKISVKHANVVKTMQFEPSTIVYDACRMIRERIPEAQMGNATEFGMFLADEDPKKGVWLEAGRTLDYYLLRSGDLLEYKKKHRPLKVRMLDGTVKTVMVDDSHTVAQLLVTICTRIGITNHDEYSLVREGEKIREAAEPPTPVKKNYYGTMTRTMTRLSLDRTLMRDEKKMEALKKKLHTDDELNWLDHGRTLREQGIDDTETLLLRRKFFYSDQNVDSRDPVQLNLLYVQARDGILNGTHPVTVDEAMMFAAYQTQIQFGDHIETKHKSGFLDLKEFLPKEYVKNKGIEKKIWLEHRKLAGLSELDAKVRYTQQCRSLKTYGVTFFLVKEKMKGKNKLVPRLLGITKDSVMRVDEKTKEILKVWPLTTVRRWAASPKSFTLDFGDYSESYYSVQTTEGETISQLIAGYIDIILRKKKGKDRFGLDGEEESTMLEDSVSPARATIMQHQENKVGHVNEGSVAIPAVMRAHDGAESYSTGTMPRAEYATIRGQIHSAHMPPINTQAQQALMGNISSGFNSISAAQAELGSRAELPPLGSDPASLKWKQNTLDVSKQNVTSQLAAMSAATASVVTLTSDDWKKLDLKHQKIVDRFRGTPNNVKGEPEQTDYTAVGSAVTTISSNLTEMSKGIKMVAALLEDYGQGERLLDAARNLAGAFSDLLSAAKPGSTEGPDLYEACRQLMIAEHEFLDQIQPYLPGPRQNLLTAAGNIGEHGREVLHEMGEVDTDPRFQDALMALAKAVANATATLVLKAKNVASKAEDPAMQNKVIASATQTALSTSQLVACTKVVAPTISHPACQEQLIDAAKLVAKSVEKTVDSAQMATQEEFLLKDLGAAATQVTQALNDLLQHIKQASKKAKKPEKIEEPEPEELESTDDEKRDSEKSDEEDEEERRRREEEERLHRERVMGDLNTAVRNVLDQLGPEDAAVGGDLNDAVRRVMKTTSDLLSEIKFEPKPEEIEEPPQVTTTVVATRESVDGGRRNEALLAELDLVVRMAMDQMSIGDDGGGSDLNDAVRRVVRRLNDLLSEIKFEAKGGEQYEDHCDTIISASDRLFASMGNASDMIKQAKILAEATSHLVNSIKTSADTTDDTDSQKRLLGAAKVLADATARMVEAAKGCAVNPHDSDEQENLRKAAEDLRAATNAAAGNAIKKKLVSKLETSEETVTVKTMTFTKVKLTHYDKDLLKKILEELQNAAKHAAAVATQTIAASQAAASSNKNPSSQQQLVSSCKHVADHIPRLVQGVRGSRAQPDSPSAQLLLINASQEFISPANNMNSAAKAAVPTVSDQAASMQLSNCSKQLAQALAELRSSAQKAQDACGPLEIDSALDTIRQLDSDLVEIKKSAAEGQLVPLPDESGEQCAQELGHTSKTVGASMAQLLTAAAQGNENYTGLAARDTANALRTLTGAVRGVAAATSDRQAQDHLIDTARDVMDKSINLIEEAKKAVNDPNNPDNQQRLAQVAKAVSHALNNCVNCLPGQRDVDFAIRNIGEASKALLSGQLQKGDVSFQEVQTMLSTAAQELNMASSELVVASKGTHEQLAQASGKFSKDFSLLLEAGMQMAAQTSDEEQQSLMVSNLKSISMSSSKLLLAAKSLSADPNAPNAKNQLASAARSVTDSINQLINICMQTAPGQKECDNALRNIETVTEITEVHTSSSSVETTETRKVSELKKDMEMHIVLPHPDIITKSVEVYISHFNSQTRVMRSMLDNPMEPVNDLTYFDCLETVMDKSKTLGESMSSITQHAKNSEHEEFGSAVTRASTAVCGLTEAAAQTAYLVGIADPSSQAGRQGLVDQSQFARANQAIQMACQQLLDPTTSQAQVRAGKSSTVTVLSAATVIAKHTSSLCNMCRVASTKTSNPVAKRHFVQSAKEVANSTANLVKSIKALDGNFTEQNRQQVAEASRPLMEAVENLTTFASNPEFASVPAQISIEARKAQEPIVIAGRTIIDSTSSLITTAKLLAVNPKDPPTWQLLAGHSKTVSDSIKRLIASIRDKAPGQRECDRGIEVINQCIRDVDQASLSAVTQKLEPRNEGTTQIFQEQMNNAAHEIGKNVDGVASAAKEKAEKLGHQVTQLSSYFDPLASAAINLASKTMNSQKQENILEQTKTVAESALQLVYTSKEGGGNPKATHAHAAIDEAAEGMKEAVDDLLKTLDESASETGAVFGMVDGITKAMSDMVDGRLEDKPAGSFVDYQTKMVKIAKQLARTSHDMVGKASSSPDELGPQANALSHDFSELAAQSKGAMATINSPELSDRIRNSVQDLGNSCVDVVNNAGAIQSNPSDTYAKKDLIENSRAVSEKVSFVLASLQAGSRGTQACINAASTVSGIIGDLDTTIMFASAGTLSPEMEDEAFADHRENILKTAKALVEDTKTLVSGAASSQEHLAAAAQSAVDTITKLADAVKSGAASLGPQDAEAQVLLINAVKDVAVALGELIEATKNASGKPVQDPSMVQLKNSAKQLLLDIQNQYQVTKPNQPRWENYINSLATEQTKKSSTSRTYVTKTSTSQVVTTKTQTQGYMVGRTVERKEIAQDEKKAERNHMSLPPPRKMFRQPSPGYSDVSDTERTDTPVHELAEEPSENVFDIVKRFETPEMQRLYIEEGRDSPLMRRLSPSPRPESPLISRHAKSVTRTTEVQSPITYVVERVISPTADKSPDVDNGPTKALRPKSPTPESQPALFPGRKSPVPGRKSPLLRSQSPVPGKRSPLLGSQSPVPGKRSPLLGSQSPVPGKKSPIPGRLSPGDRPRSPYLNVVHSSTERPLTPEPHARTLDLRPLSPSWKGSDADGRMEKKVQFTKVVVRESTDRELENKLKKRREIADSVIVGEQPSEMGSGRGGEGGLVALLEDRVKVTAPDVEPEVYGSQSMVRSREAHKVSMEEKAPVCEVVQEESSFIPPCSTASPVGHPLPDDVPTVSEPSQLPRGYLATVSMQPPPPLPEPPAIHPADHLASVSEQPLPEPPVIHPYDHLATDSEPPAIHTPPLPEPPVIHSPDHLATVSELPVIPPPLFEPPSEALKPPDLVTEVDRVTEEVEALETVEMSTDLVPPPDVIEIKERKEEETSSISITTSTQQKQMETAETATASETVREEEGKDDTETSERSSYIGFDSPVPEEMAEVAEGGQKGVSPESLAKIAADKIQESELEESESDTDIEMCYDVTPGGLETIYELSDEQEDPHSMEFEHALENVQFDEESGRWFAATGLKPAFARKVLVQKKKQVEKIVEVKEEEIEEESKAETESMPTEAGKEEGLFRGLPIVRERKWDEKFRQEEEERIIKELAEEEERAIAFKKAEEERAIAFKKAEEERAIAFRKAEEERIAEEERQREEAKMFRGIPLVRERKWDERFRQEDERRLMMELSTTEAADLEVSKDEETGRDDVLVDDVSRQQPVELVEIPSLLEEEDDVFLPEKPAEILKEEPEMMPKEKTPSPPPQEDVKKVTTSSEATVVEKDVVQPDSEPTKDAVEDKPVQEPRITKTKPDEATVEKKGRVTAAEVAALPSFTGLKKTYAEVVKLGIMDKVGTQTRKEEYKAPSEMTTLLPKPQKKQSPSFEIDVQRKTTFETEFSRSPPKVQFEDITVVMEMSDEEMVQEEEQEASPAEEEQNLSQEPNLSQEASHSSFESETDFEVAKLWKRSEMAMMPGLEKGLEEGKLYEATNFGDKGEHDKVSTVEMLSKSPPKVRFSPVVEIIQTREIEQTMSEQLSSETNSSDEDESSASDAKDSDDHDSGGEAGGPAEEDAGGADEEKDDDDGPDERKDEEDADEDSREPTGEPEQDAAMLSAESELSASEDNLGEEVSSEMETDHDNDRDIFEELIQDNMKRMEELLHHKENLAQEKEQFHQQAALYSLAVKVSENRGAKRRLQRVTRSNTQALFGDDDDEEEQEEEDAEESAERSGMEQLEGRVMDVDTGSDSEWSKQLATGPGIEQLEIARKLSPQETLTTKSPEPAPEEASEEELEKVGSWNMESIIADLMQDYYLLEAEWDTEASETEASQDTSSEAAGPSASSQKHTAAVPDRAAREQYDGFPSPPDMSLLGQDGGGWGAEDATNKDHQEQYNQQRNDQSQVPLTEGTDIPWGGEEELPPPPFFDFSEEGAMEDYHRYYDSDSYGAARETAGASREFPAFDGQRGEARRGKGRGREGEESKEDELARMIRLASCELYGGADSPRIMHKQRSASDLMATDTSSIASSSRTASASDLAELLQEAASEDMEFLEKYSKEGRRVRKRKVRVESDFRSHLEKILRKRQEKMSEKGSSTPELVKMFRSESMESFLSKEPEEKKKKIGGSVPSSPVPSSPAPSSPVPRRREEEPLLQLQQLFTGRPPTGLGRGDRPKQLVLIRRKKNEP